MFSSLMLLLSSLSLNIPNEPHVQPDAFSGAQKYLQQLVEPFKYCAKHRMQPLGKITAFLKQKRFHLSPEVINKVLSTLNCTNKFSVDHNAVITIIDYSLPSSKKRLWVFDLYKMKLLYHTYVSHGIASGTLFTETFSNRNNSRATSLGVYRTIGSYYGRMGYSLRLQGLDNGFNDNAEKRYIVMHGGWYMDENFIKKYGRPGRSWGCPALPLSLTRGIIKTIKDNSLLIAYYPSESWYKQSRYLNCQNFCKKPVITELKTNIEVPKPYDYQREAILFADKNKDAARTENEPVVAINANTYQNVFHAKAPLKRMLRRRINKEEYIVLTKAELASFIRKPEALAQQRYNELVFVIPVVKNVRGYYKTEMHPVNLGQIKAITIAPEPTATANPEIIVEFVSRPSMHLRTTDHFIRWLGL